MPSADSHAIPRCHDNSILRLIEPSALLGSPLPRYRFSNSFDRFGSLVPLDQRSEAQTKLKRALVRKQA
jgi:hypothetical protein